MKGNVWNSNVSGRRVHEFDLTFDGRDWTVRRILHFGTTDVEYKRRDMNKFHSRFKEVPESWEDAIDRVIDKDEDFVVSS